MVTEAWDPNDYDVLAASQGYIRYASGATILHDPIGNQVVEETSFHNDRENLLSLVLTAEGLMVGGLRQMIQHVNHPRWRTNRKNMGRQFSDAVPHMSAVIERVFGEEPERMHTLSPILDVLRPAPILNKTIYEYLCHGRYKKLPTLWLMDELPPARGLSRTLTDRTLAEYAAKYERTKKAA